jgi:hypothetical protein
VAFGVFICSFAILLFAFKQFPDEKIVNDDLQKPLNTESDQNL